MSKDNLRLWDAVCQTDPRHTRKVNQRGGFTAIDSYYQIKRATDLFGPLGHGWGYTADMRFEGNLVFVVLSLWYMWQGKKSEPFTVVASNQLMSIDKNGKQYVDEDAGKKAVTDAITKGLSYLGFSADIFTGKFDDNRYVQELERKLRQEEAHAEIEEEVTMLEHDMEAAINSIADADSYHLARERLLPAFRRLRAIAPEVAGQYEQVMKTLKAKYDAKPGEAA